MIESLSVTNLYCFKERTEISFVACKERNRESDLKYNGIVKRPHVNLLKTVYLFGANGAGKTNLLNAFGLLHTLIIEPRNCFEELLPQPTFIGDASQQNKCSEIEIEYVCGDKRYRYCIQWRKEAIYKEELWIKGVRSESCLFRRVYDSEKEITRVDFFAGLAISESDKKEIRRALLRNVSVIYLVSLYVVDNKTLFAQWSFFRKQFKVSELTRENLYGEINDCERLHKKTFLHVLQSVGFNIQDFKTQSIVRSHVDTRWQIFFTRQIGNGTCFTEELDDMSQGTLQTIHLLACILEAVRENKTLILDSNIESIHPDVLNNLLQMFLAIADHAQLIIASHNYSLLDMQYIRRDSIRFLYQNEQGESKVESIALGELHKNQNLHKMVATTDRWNQQSKINTEGLENVIKEWRMNQEGKE